jgi:hypothetical protein
VVLGAHNLPTDLTTSFTVWLDGDPHPIVIPLGPVGDGDVSVCAFGVGFPDPPVSDCLVSVDPNL